MKETTKRILSFVLAVVMVLGLLPGLSLNVSAAGDTHYLMFATDRHADTQVIGSIINNMESAIGENELEYLGLGGDMVGSGNSHPAYSSSEVLSEVTNATSSLSAANVDIVAGIHDMNANDDAGIVLSYQNGGARIYEGEDYYVYGVEEYCISEDSNEQNWSAQADAFESWANSDDVDPSKVIIVLSHYPLHAKRDDNDGAMYWHWALNSVATGNAYGEDTTVERDIVFFHGHNHTKDSNEYVYNVGDTMTIQNMDRTVSATIYYTYATAGYLNQNKKATLVAITDDQIVLTKYGTSGTGTAMATVDRVVNEPVVEPSEPEETEVTLTGIRVVNNKDTYYVGDELDITVFATYSDNTKVEVEDYTVSGFDSSVLGAQSVLVSYGDFTTSVSVNVVEQDAAPVLTGLKVTYSKETLLGENLALKVTAIYDNGDAVELAEGAYTVDGYNPAATGAQGIIVTYETQSYGFNVINTDAVTVVADGMASLTVTDVTGTLTETLADKLAEGFVAYDIVPDKYNVENNVAVVSIPAPEGANAVYYWNEETKALEPVSDFTIENGKAVFTTNHFSAYVVGESTEITVPDPETATGTSGAKKTVYVLTNSPSAGEDYLIVNGNTAGSYYALANNNGSVAATGVTVKTDSTIGTYIELADAADALWTAGGSYTFVNDGDYLGYTTSGSWGTTYTFGLSSTARTWSYSSNRLSTTVGSWSTTTYYLRYNEGWTWTSSSSASGRSVYFYIPTEIDDTVSGTYSIAGNPAELTKVVTNGSAAELGSVLTFTPDSGTATTTDVSATATYTVVENGDPNSVIKSISGNTVTFSGNYGKALVKISYTTSFGEVTNYIVVNASEPTYALDITSDGNVVTGTTISKKGVTATTTMQLGTKIQFVDEDGAEVVELPKGATIEWHIPEEYHTIATVGHDTGLVSFKGVDGAFYVTATLTVNGKDYTVGVNISATTTSYSVPSDGAADFPEYPNEGAIRYDKTATAVGNFSQTGIAQVELSMTGVPYTTGSEIDVVVMLDMTGSMDDVSSSTSEPTGYVRIDATIAASKAFISTIVTNEDGSYNGNRVGIYVFNKNGAATLYDFGTVDSDTELEAIYADLETIKDDHFASGGTPYDDGLAKCQEVLAAAKTDGIGNNRQQFTIFMTDGVPTSYAYVNGSSYGTHSSASAVAGMLTSASNYAIRDTDYKYEYYSTEMKKDGVTVYAVGVGLENENNAWSGSAPQCLNLASALLNDISGPAGETTQPDAVGTSTHSKQDKYFFSVEDATAGADMTKVFSDIAVSILQAATDITVEDQITDEYTMIFDIPEGSKDITGVTNDFYIEFGKYALDENHERTEDGYTSVTKLYLQKTNGVLSAKDAAAPVFEQKTIGDKGCLYYWSTNAADGDAGISVTVSGTTYYFVSYGMKEAGYNMTSGAYANGTVDKTTNMSQDLVIATPYFVYNASTKMLYWTVDKLDTNEYVLRYFLYLNNSATEVGVTDKETAPGSYLTNDHAYITYTNFNGNDCRQEFPKPQLTWNGAQVSYVFYLVNAAGQPINKSGQVVDFANATFITDVYTEAVVWNKAGETSTGKGELSANWLADDLLPEEYEIYDEKAHYALNVYENADGSTIKNQFTITGGTAAEISASLNSRLKLATTTASISTTKVYNTKAGMKVSTYGTYTSADSDMKDFDFANTTVAFAVVWQPRLVEDVVVVDYGLDVLINVVENDILQNEVTGIGLGNAAYGDTAMNTGVSTTSKLGTAALKIDGNTIAIENESSVRFHQGDMEFAAPVVFYYETPVEFWEGSNPTEGYMHSSVTVIPATTIYYEDEYVKFTVWDMEDNLISDTEKQWQVVGTSTSATQAQDRPGASLISKDLDADNNYGYDDAYAACTEFSLGSARKVTVDSSKYAEAQFTFAGTGFDLISLTSNTTGVIMVDVYDAEEFDKKAYEAEPVKTVVVDTYYGYTKTADGKWVAAPDTENSLYQVPVAEVADLPYDTYTVVITAAYSKSLGHNNKASSYDFYLDAIRIYDPANDGANSTVIKDAYKKDHEGWPSYIELRNKLIEAKSFGNTDADAELEGMVFIDGMAAVNSGSISQYISYGPNNEVYLDAGQSVAFQISDVKDTNEKSIVDRICIGMKSADGSDVTYTMKNINASGTVTNEETFNLNTSTDMYYNMTEWKDGIVVITNTGSDGILSITNIKTTYTEKPADLTRETSVFMTPKAAETVLMALKPQPVNPFADVNQDQFFYESVLWAVSEGITNGVDAAHFGPYLTCNRAQVVTFLWRAAGSPAPASRTNPFKDVPENSWYTDAVLWAVENGITNGLSADAFGPNALCNRAQVVTFLWRANGSKVAAAENPFADVPADAFYRDAVVWALRNGITTGATASTFDPNGTCMRAHVVTFLDRAEQLPEVMACDNSYES